MSFTRKPSQSRNLSSILLLLIFVFSALPLAWGGYRMPLRFTTLSTEQGLPDTHVSVIAQDADGFLWFGTKRGVARYDGREFLRLKHASSAGSTVNQNVTALVFDQDNTMWVGSSAGLSRLDKTTHQFIDITNAAADDTRYSVTALLNDSQNRLWVGTTKGVDRYVPESQTTQAVAISGEVGAQQVYFLQEFRDMVLMGTSHGLYFYHASRNLFLPLGLYSPDEAGHDFREVRSMVGLSENKILVNMDYALFELTLARIDQEALRVDTKRKLFNNLLLHTLLKDQQNIIWLASDNEGLLLYDHKTASLRRQRPDPQLKYGLKNETINAMYQSHEGVVWLAVAGNGVQKWLPVSEQFGLMQHHPNQQQSLTDGAVLSIAEDELARIWVGTAEGLTLFDPRTQQYKALDLSPPKSAASTPVAVYAIEISDDGWAWVGTAKGLSQINIETLATRSLTHDSSTAQSIPWGAIKSITSFSDDKLWLVNELGGLYEFDTLNRVTRALDLTSDLALSPGFISAKFVQQSRFGGIWIATDAGLIFYHPKAKRKLVITHTPNSRQGLNSTDVSALYEDADGGVWVGTLGNGLNYISIQGLADKNKAFDYYDFSTDTYPAKIHSILPGADDYLWLSSSNGLVRFHKKTQETKRYSQHYGLQGEYFSLNAALASSRGELYFGGKSGLTHFDPKALKERSYSAPLRIANIRINDQPLITAGMPGKLDKVALSYEDIMVSVQFALLDYGMPSKHRYQVKLEGLNENWLDLGTRNEASYINLPKGQYALKIRGINHVGQIVEDVAPLKIVVQSPWWTSAWAYLLYLLTAALIVAFIMLERYKKLAAERREALGIKEREEKLKQVLWGSGDEMWDWHIDSGRIERTQPLPCLGYNATEELVMDMSDVLRLIHAEDRKKVVVGITKNLDGETDHFEAVFRLKDKIGRWQWLLSRSRVVERDASGKAIRVVGTHKDINNLKSAEDQLRLIAKAFENTSDGVAVCDINFINVAVNQAFCEITGVAKEDVIGFPYFFRTKNGTQLQDSPEVLQALMKEGAWSGEIMGRRNYGKEYFIELNIDVVRDEKNVVTHYVSVFTDISFRKQVEDDLVRLTNYDSLTKLPNRTLLKQRLQAAITKAKNSKQDRDRLGLLFVDLDDFKTVNDSLGHGAGDILLRDVAYRLLTCVGELDIVSRIGSDEFIIVRQHIADRDSLVNTCERIKKVLKSSFDLGSDTANITPTIGIAVYPEDGEDADTLIKHSDIAMYHAKQAGKNKYLFFSEDMNRSAMERLKAENTIRSALDKGDFKLFYQAKVNAKTLSLSGFEALIRWQDPEKGFVLPVNFITVAEESGLIVEIGEWILREVCGQIREWQVINPQIKVAVNLSAIQFQDKFMVTKIMAVLEEYKVQPSNIEFEITESTLMSDIPHAKSVLNELSSLGFTLALDDFGTGYSSLKYLQVLPVHKVKIDQSFVRDIHSDEGDQNIVSTIVKMSHSMNLSVIVEGVETIEQLNFISGLGGEEIQGYLFAKPVDGENATELVRKGQFSLDAYQ